MSKSAIEILVNDPSNTQAIQELEAQVAAASKTGHGAQGDNLIDWLYGGGYDGTETVESLAAEWDADRE